MAKVIYSPVAFSSLKSLYRFLAEKNPVAALRAIQTIQERLKNAILSSPSWAESIPSQLNIGNW